MVPCYGVVTTGEILGILSYNGDSDVRLRLSTSAIQCGNANQLDLNCNHVLQAMYPRLIRTRGDDSLSKTEEQPNQYLPNEEYYGEHFDALLRNPNRGHVPLEPRSGSIMPRRAQTCVAPPIASAANADGSWGSWSDEASSSAAAPPAAQLMGQSPWSW